MRLFLAVLAKKAISTEIIAVASFLREAADLRQSGP